MPHPIRATYRLQLHPGFGFSEAAAIVDYLAELGVSHAYCSPYLQAAPGSMHGYDVVDHDKVNRELGGEEGHRHFVHTLSAHGLGQVLDIVPNHMAISSRENRWWMDVLENGTSSYYDEYFDLEWAPPEVRLRGKVLIPVLGDHYGRVLEAGELSLNRHGARFDVRYGESRFPVDPRSIGGLVSRASSRCGSVDLAFLGDALSELPPPTTTESASVARRHRDKAALLRWLARVLDEQPSCAVALDDVLNEVNADHEALHAVLEQQSYRLAWWRSAGRDLSYRRFFDVNTLIGLRTEDRAVFADIHRRVLEWVQAGEVDGLRIDHPDGLRDPEEYCERLCAAAPHQWVVLEKVLMPGEELPETWPVAGTTGYDFLNRVVSLFVDPAGEGPLTELYGSFTGQPTDYREVVVEKKQFVLREVLGSDVNRVTDLLVDLIEQYPTHRDYTRHQLTDAVREIVARLPIYRTYVRPSHHQARAADRAHIDGAIDASAASREDLERPLFDFIRSLLLLEREGRREHEFVTRFQQLTGPAMAKGVEDTAFYVFNRFVALNEVGGDPTRFGLSPDGFHAATVTAARRWPLSMLATDTHDAKRGEDVRARLALLSEIPEQWALAVQRWSDRAARHRTGPWPDRNAEYLFYQTLVGAWPLEAARARAYMVKAAREAKTFTTWTGPHAAYEQALERFADGVLDDPVLRAEVEAFVQPLMRPGWTNALSQTLVKLTAPGIPDLYQGTELWAFTLVDPDNRRPVDYARRRRLLAEVKDLAPEEIWCRAEEGLPKLWVTWRALELRRRRPSAFASNAQYEMLRARGSRAAHVVAFKRDRAVVTVVPRLVLGLNGQWADTTLSLGSGTWRNVLTGDTHERKVRLGMLLERFPVALLERDGD